MLSYTCSNQSLLSSVHVQDSTVIPHSCFRLTRLLENTGEYRLTDYWSSTLLL